MKVASGEMEVLLVFNGFDVKVKLVNIKEGEVEGGDDPGKLDRIATVKSLKEKRSESWPWVYNKKISSINLSQGSGFESSEFRKFSINFYI